MNTAMNMLAIIAKRRDGEANTEAELRYVASAAANGSVPDYQLSAWLMAAFLNPLSKEETAWLTTAMADSGERIDLSGLPKPWVDKHSTGGVGDKTTLVLLPILAACGLTVVKMSGRGLGITGGTADKLASVPGFRMDLTPDEMRAQAAKIGLAITGSSPNLAPADKALYALRDATGTTDSIPLITSSILSKKIAGGAETVVFDVKCGSGAFMKSLDQAKKLSEWLTKIGEAAGLRVAARITDMDQPLGSAVGSTLEVIEAIRVLRCDPLDPTVSRFRELCVAFAALALHTSGVAATAEAETRATEALESGAALDKARQWFDAQGADPSVFDDPSVLLQARETRPALAAEDGWVRKIPADAIGAEVINLGGGRRSKQDDVDPHVGIEVLAPVGSKVSRGDRLATVHARTEREASDSADRVRSAIEISSEPVVARPLFLN